MRRFLIFLLLLAPSLHATKAHEAYTQALAHDQAGEHAAALKWYQQALARDPLFMPAWFSLGIHHAAQHAFFQAVHCFEKASALAPDCPEICYNLGLAHASLDNHEQASKQFTNALRYNPAYTKAAEQLAQITKHSETCVQHNQRPSPTAPRNVHTITEYKELTQKAIDAEQYTQACAYLTEAFAYGHPNPTEAFELACLCTQLGMTQQAIAGFNQVCAVSPGNKAALYNIAFNHKIAGDIDTAIAIFQDLITQHPDYSNAEFSLARAYIKKGDFIPGWQHSIPYFKESGKYAPELRAFLANNTLAGKKVLLRPEGHFGDTIQFIRHAQTLKERGAIIIACIQPELIPLLSPCDFIDHLIPLGSTIPQHDASATLMSLPAILQVTEETIPKTVPYLFPDEELVAYWKNYLADKTDHFKIGLCWQASVHNDASRPPIARRGVPLSLLYALGSMPNVSLFCLQKIDGMSELDKAPAHFVMHCFDTTFDGPHGRFMDTAAVMKNLDLVITVDTAIAHLAGALGVPVWVMLPYETDWRWIEGRTDSPWYPTMRLFQQPAPFDWESVAENVINAVRSTLDSAAAQSIQYTPHTGCHGPISIH